MRANTTGILLLTVVEFIRAQPLDLRGRAIQANGLPVADAIVELKIRGSSARTAPDGSFALDVNSSLGSAGARSYAYRLKSDILAIDARAPMDLRMEVLDGTGRRLGGLDRHLGTGSHRIALAEALPASGPNAGLYFLRLQMGGQTVIHPFFHIGNGLAGTVYAPAYLGVAAKRAAVVDTLRIRKPGFRDFVNEITSYTAGNLGDLVLTVTPDGGGVCASQRTDHLGDGTEVVVCETLFDQVPRAHLPAATASSAYAMMTSTAFVTVDGASFAFTRSAQTDSEMTRHASALYKIEIQGGKMAGFRPAVLFEDSLFMAPLMGKSFEGFISKRANGRYELEPSLPVRVRVSYEPYKGGGRSSSLFQVQASIVNLNTAVTAAGGTCMPSLSSYGAQAPFASGADVSLLVGRVPSMHTFGDDELVFELYTGGTLSGSIMSSTWFFTPLDLVGKGLTPSGKYSGIGHGTPGTIPMLNLEPSAGSGAPCAP